MNKLHCQALKGGRLERLQYSSSAVIPRQEDPSLKADSKTG